MLYCWGLVPAYLSPSSAGVHSDPLGVLIHVSVDVPAALSTVPTRWDDDDTRKVLAELQPDVISGAWRD